MKNPLRKRISVAAILAVVGLCTVAGAQAAESGDKGAKNANDLARYDKNHNGKLDPDEAAAVKAASNKQNAEKKAKGTKK